VPFDGRKLIDEKVDELIADANAKAKALFAKHNGKPIDEVLSIVRRSRLAKNGPIPLSEDDLLAIAESISEGVVPVFLRGPNGARLPSKRHK
jgi:hypothetical protein